MDPTFLAVLGVGVGLATIIVAGQRSLRADFNARMDRLDSRMDRLESRLTARMDRIDEAIRSLSDRVSRLEGGFAVFGPPRLPALPESKGEPTP